MKAPPWSKPGCNQQPLKVGSVPTTPCGPWASGLALSHSQGKESGSPARALTFQLAAVVGGMPVLLVLPVVPRGCFVPRHL